MKKSAKPILLFSFLLIISITIIFLISVGLKVKYEEMTKEKDKAEQILKAERLKKVNLTADYQSVTLQESIVPAALVLGLVKRIQPQQIIYVDSKKIENINQILEEKYE